MRLLHDLSDRWPELSQLLDEALALQATARRRVAQRPDARPCRGCGTPCATCCRRMQENERVDGSVKRRMALKLPFATWGEALSRRLARGRDIVASLAPTNIARLYDACVGAHGRPFLAPEHVEGLPINRMRPAKSS